MIVEFNPKLLLGNIRVSTELKQYYEKNIEAIATIFSEYIDISNVKKIVVPNNFVDEVLEYQVQLGYKNPSVTNNEFGKAYGKLLLNQHSGKHIVFLDSEIATFLMGDSLTENIIKIAGEENRKTIEDGTQKALNLLAHELSHAEFANKVKQPTFNNSYQSQLENLCYQLLDEYYVCRKSSYLTSINLLTYDENYIYDIEERIIDEKWKYKTHQISLNDFCNYFHLLTRQTLINMVSIVSVLDKDLSNSAYYENCLIGMIVDIFKTEFDRIYYDIHDDKKFVIPNSLLEAINSYYQAFGVYISEEPRGLYYYIPD